MALTDLIAHLKAAQTPELDDADTAARARVRKSLHAIAIHLQGEGVPLALLAPLHHLNLALADIAEGRSNDLLVPATMKPGTSTKQMHETLQWATAAAAITVLKDNAKMQLADAVKEAAKAIGADKKKLAEFRKNISKDRVSHSARKQYDGAIQLFKRDSKDRPPEFLAAIVITILRDLREKG